MKIFWKTWELTKLNEPEGEFRDEFVKDLIRVFLKYDCDPQDFREIDPEIEKLYELVDPELP